MIFGPMRPGGVLERLLDVTARISSSDVVRNGPPDAVMSSRRTSSTSLAAQALPDRAMLAIHRQDGDAVLLRLGGDDMASEDERLFVGQRDGLAGADRRQRRLEADHAGGRRDDGLHVGMRRRRG